MTDTRQARTPREIVPPPLELPRDEMAFRREYEQLLIARMLTTVFRPGDRRWPNWRGYRPGEEITARVIARPGSDTLRIPPQFSDLRIGIDIVSVDVHEPDALTADHFIGSSPDVCDRETMLRHLLAIYGAPLDAFGGVVTRIQFRYRDEQ